MKQDSVDILSTLSLIRECLSDHKAQNISTINLQGKTSFADYMIIASCTSTRQVIANATYLQEKLKRNTSTPVSTEGLQDGNWVLIDTGDIIVHIFRQEVREFYNIEDMWTPSCTSHITTPAQ